MKSIETWIYGVLLLVSLGLAYNAWQSEGEDNSAADSRDVVVFDPGSGGAIELHWQGEKSVASVEIEGKGDDLRSWVSAGRRSKIAAPAAPAAAGDDDSAGDASAETAEPPKPVYGEAETRSFPGGKQVKELAARFAPLRGQHRTRGLCLH